MTATATAAAPSPTRGTRREEIAWAMYDWASSAWSTLQITVVVGYLQNIVFDETTGGVIYGYCIGISMFLAALSSPVIGALADARANKRTWLIGATCLGAGSAILMGVIPPGAAWVVAACFFLTNLGFELCWGIYNGFLPEIADDESMNRVSAWGFAFGYVGGGLMLLVALVIYNFGESLGLVEVSTRLRVGIALMGLWWLAFSLPAFIVLRDRQRPLLAPLSVLAEAKVAFRQVGTTLSNIRHYGMLSLFLLGFLFYNDGMQTVISQASVFARNALSMQVGELSMMILMVQFVSLPGALLVGKMSDWIGAKRTLHINLAVWVGLLIAAFFVTQKWQFWVMAAILALVMGGSQSVSRAIMGFMTPQRHAAEFMGFFNLSGRAASMLGPLLFATIFGLTHSAHYAILSLLVFFVVGWLLVWPVNIKKGQKQAQKAETA
jgi:UMF1 family MFS transporter